MYRFSFNFLAFTYASLATLALVSSSFSPWWFSMSLGSYLEACHEGVGFSSFLYKFLKWLATCRNSAITNKFSISHMQILQLGYSYTCRITSLSLLLILYLLLLISLLSSSKPIISLLTQLLIKVVLELLCLSISYDN